MLYWLRNRVRRLTPEVLHPPRLPRYLVGDRKGRTPQICKPATTCRSHVFLQSFRSEIDNAGAEMMVFSHKCYSLRESLTNLFQPRWEGCLVPADFSLTHEGINLNTHTHTHTHTHIHATIHKALCGTLAMWVTLASTCRLTDVVRSWIIWPVQLMPGL